MIIRALDNNLDWTFGFGLSNYKENKDALAQDINSQLFLILNECFFDAASGIDWINLLGGKNSNALNIAISTTLLNVSGVTGIRQASSNLDADRNFSLTYSVNTIYGVLNNIFQYDANAIG